MNTETLRRICLAVSLVLLCGCGGSRPATVAVRGRVTYRDKPVTSGTVFFCPADPSGSLRPATAALQEDGSYRLSTFDRGDGVLAGEYLVAVRSFTMTGSSEFDRRRTWLVPERYADPNRSGLRASVAAGAGGPLEFDFDLTE